MVRLTEETLRDLINEIVGEAAQRKLDLATTHMTAWHDGDLQASDVFTLFDDILQDYNRVYISLNGVLDDFIENGEKGITKSSTHHLRAALTGVKRIHKFPQEFRDNLKSIIDQVEASHNDREIFEWLKKKYPDADEEDLTVVAEDDNKFPLRLLELAPEEVGDTILEHIRSDRLEEMDLAIYKPTVDEAAMLDYITEGKGLTTDQARGDDWILSDKFISAVLTYLTGW